MAKFTFASGNSAALRRLPIYLLGALATFAVPRTGRIWVFGCGTGPGEGALPLYRLARDRLRGQVRVVWLATTAAELERARGLGLDAVPKLTWVGFWLTLRARVAVVTHGLGDVNRYGVRGAFVVQLWHGVPLKKLHLDSRAAFPAAGLGAHPLVRAGLRRGMRAAGAQIRLFPVASERVVGRIASAFGVPRERVVVTGDPRDDVLLAGTPSAVRAAARTRLDDALGRPLPAGARVVLYAPTWRDGEHDPGAPDAATWAAIGAWLERRDAVLIVRVHPLGHGDYAAGPALSERVRLLTVDALSDVTPILPAADAVITDYSSIAYDAALCDVPSVLLAPDLEAYTASRGLYEPYRTFSGGRHVPGWPDVLAQLDALADPSSPLAVEVAAHTRWLREEHFDLRDGRATERVFTEIVTRLRPGRPVPPSTGSEGQRPVLTGARFEPGRLFVELDPAGRELRALRLDGPRLSVEAPVEPAGAGRVGAWLPLLVTRWGTSGLALPSGDYRLTLLGETAGTRVDGAVDREHREPLYRARVVTEDGGVVVRVGPPLADGERRPGSKLPPSLGYALTRARPENAVWFESFYGRAACDNPLGIDRVLARDHPAVRRYWSVVDGSVPVPAGAVRLIEGSAEWWRARAAARVLVVNDWLRWYVRPSAHQHVLQTWHGTMLKKLALDRPGRNPRERLASRRQGRRWDALLAQNDYSAAILRSAYGFAGPIWVTGYPRNDGLAEAARADRVRAAVGATAGQRVVLYAPTWRDDRDRMIDYLDASAFAASLPADHVLLVRGHSRTLAHGQDATGPGLIDVTSYPDVADLMLIADVLVTDYSSVMFDFAVTGRPIVFYTPDAAHYGEVLRGFYFDLAAKAPGPVVTSPDALRTAIAEPQPSEYAERYAAWRREFVPLDDGHAAERAVQHMYAAGWLD